MTYIAIDVGDVRGLSDLNTTLHSLLLYYFITSDCDHVAKSCPIQLYILD
jgi:hypothetical protein